MTTRFEHARQWLSPGQPIMLEPGSPIYKGPYESKVLEVGSDRIRVGVPLDEGKLVLLPVGTQVVVKTHMEHKDYFFNMEIVMRTGGKNRSLFLTPVLTKRVDKKELDVPRKSIPAIAIGSGKGGVGKTTLVVNLAIALSRMGHKVCVIDGDLGTANVDVLFNLSPAFNLAHVIHGEKHMLEVVVEGPEGVIVLPGGSGFQELTTLSDKQFNVLLDQFLELEAYADFILIDTGSGLSPSVTNFLLSATQSILVTTPEPHAITDCYALIKVLASQKEQNGLQLVVNRVGNAHEGMQVGKKMAFASKRFLETDVHIIGCIHEDSALIRSIRRQTPIMMADAKARSALDVSLIARRLTRAADEDVPEQKGARGFLQKMRRLLIGGAPS